MTPARALCLPLLLAGCLAAPLDAAPVHDAPAPAAFLAEGVSFLPPSTGNERVETLLRFVVNATSMSIVADVALGSRYGPLELPPAGTDVIVELRAPDGAVLAHARLGVPGETQARLEASAGTAGEHALALLSYGGSDEDANGDYVSWRIEAS